MLALCNGEILGFNTFIMIIFKWLIVIRIV